MARPHLRFHRSGIHTTRDRGVRPRLEGLEERVLLFTSLGDQWTYDSRITYSFMPDGTSIGGVPSALFHTLNAKYATTTWEQQIEYAASLWENVSNINLSLVSDGGEPVATSGDQQGDPRFGDIRIGAVPMSAGTLAVTFLPPPSNGGTEAGDILLNSNVNWQIGSNYDLMTVVAHEFGHALGLGESTVSTAVMYGTYNGIKQALASDDIAGIDSIYGTRQFDQFNNAGTRDNTYSTSTNINAYINGAAQIAIPGLNITTPGDSEWFYVNVPATTTGKMTVTVQSSGLSSLSPKLQVYNSSLSLVGQSTAAVGSFGATISVTATVQSGQGYYFKVLAAGGPGPIGSYGLLVNFGSQPQAPISPPYTVLAQQPNQGGGSMSNATVASAGVSATPSISTNGSTSQGALATLGSLSGWTEGITTTAQTWSGTGWNPLAQPGNPAPPMPVQTSSSGVTTPGEQATQTSTTTGPATPTVPSSSTVATVAAGPNPGVLQAVDDALYQWPSSSTSLS